VDLVDAHPAPDPDLDPGCHAAHIGSAAEDLVLESRIVGPVADQTGR
jgi:hypothetical protein